MMHYARTQPTDFQLSLVDTPTGMVQRSMTALGHCYRRTGHGTTRRRKCHASTKRHRPRTGELGHHCRRHGHACSKGIGLNAASASMPKTDVKHTR